MTFLRKIIIFIFLVVAPLRVSLMRGWCPSDIGIRHYILQGNFLFVDAYTMDLSVVSLRSHLTIISKHQQVHLNKPQYSIRQPNICSRWFHSSYQPKQSIVTLYTTSTKVESNNSYPNSPNRLQKLISSLLPKRITQNISRLPQITKTMKLLFYASFLVDAIILIWGGRQTISLLLSPSSSFGTILRSIQHHVGHALAAIYPARQSIALSILVFTVIFYSMYHSYYIQQRQTIDPTSEWERYAQYPVARTMAIFQIFLFQMVPISLRIIVLQQLQKVMTRIIDPSLKDRYEIRIVQWKERMGQIFANGLLQLGPLYIKMGQILSCRENLLPKEWKYAMERLQDQVPAQTGTKAQQLAETIWPSDRLESFHDTFINVDWTPIAAASLGQVHTATLRSTNERVALKLQRPKLRTIYDNDLQLLKKIATTVDRFFGSSAGSVGGISQSWTSIFSDAEDILYREIDYRIEGQNAIRFANDFGLTKGGLPATTTTTTVTSRDGEPLPSAASWLRTPYVYDTLSTEQILVMEYVPSIKISALEKLHQANVTTTDREYLADCLGRSYLRQFCCNKFCKYLYADITTHTTRCKVVLLTNLLSLTNSFYGSACWKFRCRTNEYAKQ